MHKMKNNIISSFCSLLIVLHQFLPGFAYTYDACELANELVQVHQFSEKEIADWICLIYTESSFRTSAISVFNNVDKSRDYGLFQINSHYWCNATDLNESSPFNLCNQNCKNFLDDNLGDDIECAREIYSIHGFRAWAGYLNKCINTTNSRKIFKQNCDQVPTIDSPLIQYIHRSKPIDEAPQLPDYNVERDYSSFVLEDQFNENYRKVNKMNFEKKPNEITNLDESSTNYFDKTNRISLPTGKAITKKQLLNDRKPSREYRKYTPIDLKWKGHSVIGRIRSKNNEKMKATTVQKSSAMNSEYIPVLRHKKLAHGNLSGRRSNKRKLPMSKNFNRQIIKTPEFSSRNRWQNFIPKKFTANSSGHLMM